LFRFSGCSASFTKGTGGDVNVNKKSGIFIPLQEKKEENKKSRTARLHSEVSAMIAIASQSERHGCIFSMPGLLSGLLIEDSDVLDISSSQQHHSQRCPLIY